MYAFLYRTAQMNRCFFIPGRPLRRLRAVPAGLRRVRHDGAGKGRFFSSKVLCTYKLESKIGY